ncbi:MAG: hypothetical protein KKC39_03195 [Candidatus Omnitrophica bacterium]|nr:hypothetical protein [Candidatus Omnitrophota bacterium]MBU4467737.1 hypothetical protein [Candidatus Omnitrophota bacterium]MCG2707047.1 hypothetical protein [Candidatus Omnitrophota bacterium]
MINDMEEKIDRTAIFILIVWILITVFSGLFENYRLPRVIQEPKIGLDMPTPKIRNEIIEINLDEVYRKRP